MSSHMLDERYLIHGLDALSRAYKSDYFADGHRGAAIIAAYYFCREVPVEDGVAGIIRATLDEHWTHTGLCAPFPPERADPALITRILEAVERNVCGLRQAGHNVILPSLALRALQLLPEATTPSRVDGICRLVDAFKAIDDIHLDERDDIPDLGQGPATAEFVLSELPSTIAAFGGRGQGWSGHLLTYGRALIDMREMGYGALAHRAERDSSATSSVSGWAPRRLTGLVPSIHRPSFAHTNGPTGRPAGTLLLVSATSSSIPTASTG